MLINSRWSELNFCILPIGDNYTRDVKDAIVAADFVKFHVVVGVHYNTLDYIKIDTEKAVTDFKTAGKTLLLPQIGQAIEL